MLHSRRLVAILDACVLYPAPLRDLLLSLAQQELYRPKWSVLIQEEWRRNLLNNRPDLSEAQLNRTSKLMDNAFPDAEVRKFQQFIQSIELPDPDDRHVLAAGISCHADVIVTFNLKDFPDASLQEYAIEAVHPDQFVADLVNFDEENSATAFHHQVERLKDPPKSPDDVLNALKQNELHKTVNLLTQVIDRYDET